MASPNSATNKLIPLIGNSLNCVFLGLWNSIEPSWKRENAFLPRKVSQGCFSLIWWAGWVVSLLRGATQTPWTHGQETTMQLRVPRTPALTQRWATWQRNSCQQLSGKQEEDVEELVSPKFSQTRMWCSWHGWQHWPWSRQCDGHRFSSCGSPTS